jgi:hypothetical protein
VLKSAAKKPRSPPVSPNKKTTGDINARIEDAGARREILLQQRAEQVRKEKEKSCFPPLYLPPFFAVRHARREG